MFELQLRAIIVYIKLIQTELDFMQYLIKQ